MPDTTIRAAYDVSILGTVRAGARVGIYRATLNTARALARRPNCDMTLTVTERCIMSRQIRQGLMEELAGDSILSHAPVPGLQPGSMLAALDRLVAPLGNASSRWLRRAHTAYTRIVGRLRHEDPITPDVLRSAQLFHSPFYPHCKPVLLSGKPRFTTVYDLIPIIFPQYSLPTFNRQMHDWLSRLTRDDYVVCISQYTRRSLCEHYAVDPDKVSVAHLAADADLFRPISDQAAIADVHTRHGIGDWPYLLAVSTFEPRKNLDRLIRCFVRLFRDGRLGETRLVLVGGRGWNYDHILRALEGDEAGAKRVITTGYVPDDDLAAIYSGAMAFVFPSLVEGFGLPALEAMSCGTPVVASNSSSIPEVVGDAGLLFDPTDDDALCAAIQRMVDEPSLREQLAARSLEQAKQFSWDQCAQQTLAAYRRALSTNG